MRIVNHPAPKASTARNMATRHPHPRAAMATAQHTPAEPNNTAKDNPGRYRAPTNPGANAANATNERGGWRLVSGSTSPYPTNTATG